MRRWEEVGKRPRGQEEKMWRCEDVKMWRCEDEKMWRWADVKMWRWADVKMKTDVKMRRCEDEKMWRWADVKMSRCEDEKIWRWEDVKMRRCEDEKMWSEKMWSWEDVKMRRCEVRRCEDERQTPTIGRTLRSDALGKKLEHAGLLKALSERCLRMGQKPFKPHSFPPQSGLRHFDDHLLLRFRLHVFCVLRGPKALKPSGSKYIWTSCQATTLAYCAWQECRTWSLSLK